MLKKGLYKTALLGLPIALFSMLSHAGDTNCISKVNRKMTHVGEDAVARTCDFTFTATPTFTSMCVLGSQSGIYTIKNNTPVPVKINYIRLKNNDGGATSAATIVSAPTNSCGSAGISGTTTLPAGATCNIQVNLTPIALSTYNRVLQVGLDTRQVEIDATAITTAVNCSPTPPPSTPFGFLGATINCTVMGATTVTNVVSVGTAVNGDVCTSTGTSITGFPPGTATGSIRPNDTTAILNKASYNAAFLDRQSNINFPCDTTYGDGQDIGGMTLTPGVYCFSASGAITGAVTLDGLGNPASQWTFKFGSTITTASASSVVLTNGATRDRVFWIVGSSATLGSTTTFQGNLMAQASITLNTGATLLGRAFVRDAAISLDANPINPTP